MPRKARELGPLEIKRLSHPGGSLPVKFPVGTPAGLMVQVTPNESKSWVLRVMIGGVRRNMGLGSLDDVTLAEARAAARELKAKIRNGVDPLAERKAAVAELKAQQARGLTLRQAVERYIAVKGQEFSSEKHRKQWASEIERLVGDAIGDMQIDAIELKDVLRALEGHWLERTDTARRVRQRLERVFDWATVAEHRAGLNPARWRGGLAELLAAPKKVAKAEHHGALSLAEVADWFADLRQRDGMGARALEFLTLTAARSGEVRGATWQEIDLQAGMWTIPADRMKAGREHRVPLPAEAVALLEALPRSGDLVFPAVRGGMLSDMTLSATMRRIQEASGGRYLDPRSGRPAVPHGLRSCFRDWCAERGVDRDLAEISLAHVVGSEVERAYRRSDMLERRRALLASWGAFLRGESTGKVVNLRA